MVLHEIQQDPLPDKLRQELSIMFSGAGWLFPFYFGVGKHLQEILDVTSKDVRFSGVSAGAFVATMLSHNADFQDVLEDVLKHYSSMKYNPFLIKLYLLKMLHLHVPDDIESFNGKLSIGVSRLNMFRFKWISEAITIFKDRISCIEAITASCHMPVISGFLPCYINNKGYYDGEIAHHYNGGTENHHNSTNAAKQNAITINVGISVKPFTINPGIRLPEFWKYYPVDPYLSRKIYQLGYLRSREFFQLASKNDLEEINSIKDIIQFSLSTSHVSYWRVLYTLIIYLPRIILKLSPFVVIVTIVRLLRRKSNHSIKKY